MALSSYTASEVGSEVSGGVNLRRTTKGDTGFLVSGNYPDKKRRTLRKMQLLPHLLLGE